MAHRKNKKPVPPTPGNPNAAVLDVFSEQDLERWSERTALAQAYSDKVYFELERQRAQKHDELCAALRSAPTKQVDVHNWVRITDYRWSLTPLSSAGSVKNIGSRFNVGEQLDRARGQSFPALYIAADVDTAFAEFFGALPRKNSQLTLHEFALRRPSSFATFMLEGLVDDVLDLTSHEHLQAFAKIIAEMTLPASIQRYARTHNLKPRWLARSAKQLHSRILIKPNVWREEALLFGIPSSNQTFGRIVRDSGIQALLYPSQQGGSRCLAIFPENVKNGETVVRVTGTSPPGASCLLLDKDHPCIG